MKREQSIASSDSEAEEPQQMLTRAESGAGVSRREMIKMAGGAVVAAPLLGLDKGVTASEAIAWQGTAPLFFTREEFTLLDELTELIIPTDDHSPGARAAQVAAYIDRRLIEGDPAITEYAVGKQMWRNGLKLIDAASGEISGKPFMQASTAERTAVLARISQNEKTPQKPEEIFFVELKAWTTHGYYTSKIGIHTELEYKGNTYLKDFVGYD